MNRWTLALWIACACAGDRAPEQRFQMTIAVRTDTDEPVRGAEVSIDHNKRGHSDAQGLVRSVVEGRAGERVAITVQCPSSYRAQAEATDAVLRRVHRLNGDGSSDVAVMLRCLPRARRGALVVRVDGAANLPVRVNGEPVAHIDRLGVAHAALQLTPGADLRVTLDTSTQPDLRPASPTQRFVVEDRDGIFVLDQHFTLEKRAPRRAHKRRSALPYRIE